jgi:nicotinate phosphoribosyltransferase
LNEFKIEELVSQGASIDIFGVGTDLATSRDVPALSVVYKLVETEHDGKVEYKTKFSDQKVHWPGRKQVFRFSRDGQYDSDVVCRAGEEYGDGESLLRPVMSRGQRIEAKPPLAEVRARALKNLRRLPERYRALRDAPAYPVIKSAALEQLLVEVRERQTGRADASNTG